MSVGEILLVKLGSRLAKFLLKTYLKEPGEAVGAELVDIAKGKIEGYLDRQEAKRQFERIGERIAAQLLPFFEAETLPHEISAEAVIDQLARTLEGNISAEFFLARDLDPAKLIAELRRVRPLPRGQFSEAEVELYDRALAQAVRYIVEVAAKLPHFEVTQVKESLRRLTRIEDVVGETAEGVKRIEQWVALQESDAESRQYEIDYRLAVARNLDYLELFGADLTPESKRQALSVAYVSLTLETPASSEMDAEPSPVEIVLNGLTEDTGRLLIRGEAGSGKSTLFRWAAIRAAQGLFSLLGSARWISDPERRWFVEAGRRFLQAVLDLEPSAEPPAWRVRIPFLLRLRDCRGGQLPPPKDFPELIAKEIGSPPAPWVRAVLQAGRGLLLLDGVDEIPNLHRNTLKREIEAIIGAYPDNFFLVSTRPQAVETDWLATLGFREARVNPMSDLDRSRFIDKWHEAVATELGRMGRPADDLPQLAEELKRQLPENPSVARLATNPLLCAMICALHRDRGNKLPESQSDLCESLCQVLLHRRERESGLDLSEFPERYRSLKYPQKRLIVQEIAHSMVLNGESSVTAERAQEKVADALRSLAGQSEEDAEVVCQALVERSGMLRETKPGYLDFIHNTFKEYLAGDRFGSSGDAGLLAEHALDPTWQRVVLFAVATSRKGFADDVIRRLLDSGAAKQPWKIGVARHQKAKETDDDLLRARQLLALQCRAAALLVDPKLEVALDEIAQSMFPPKSMGDAEALAASGDIATPFLIYREGLESEEAAACVRALRLIGTQRAQAVLAGYFDERRELVVFELCQAVNPLGLKAIQEKLIAGERLANGIRSQISDLSPLSGLSSLQVLDLSDTPVSDVSALSGLSSLQRLDLIGTPVSDVSALSGLSSLQQLDLSGTPVSDVSALSGLSSLQQLDLDETPVSDISVLSALSSLQLLYLSGTLVSDISALSGLSSLQMLDLSGTPVSDVSALSGLSSLQMLDLSGTPVSDVSALSGLSSLHKLDLRGTPVSDISALSGLTSLRYLSGTPMLDVSVLSGLANLRVTIDEAIR
jgi:NACHT conflict system protein/NACHT domain-containing protein/Leucine Rich Repeat (LRR) protein